MRIFALALLVATNGFPALVGASATPWPGIAMLEDYAQTQYVPPNRHRISYEPRVRAVFLKQPNGWRSVCEEDKFGNATACPASNLNHFSKLFKFHPSRVEEVNTRGNLKPESCCAGAGWLRVVDKTHITHQHGDRLLKFGGHTHDPVLKPEVLINRRMPIGDPDSWSAIQSGEVAGDAYQPIAASSQQMLICRTGDTRTPQQLAVPWKNSHLQITERFANRHGQMLFKAKLSDAYSVDCRKLGGEVPDAGIIYPEFWIVQSDGAEVVVHLFKSKIGFAKLELLQFGDFDGDGRSEALFFRAGYNEDGYELFHHDMKRTAKFTWGYH